MIGTSFVCEPYSRAIAGAGHARELPGRGHNPFVQFSTVFFKINQNEYD